MIEGPVTSQLTASALQLHPWTIAISDPAAASKLKHLAYYQHVDRETADQPVLPPWILQPALDPRVRWSRRCSLIATTRGQRCRQQVPPADRRPGLRSRVRCWTSGPEVRRRADLTHV